MRYLLNVRFRIAHLGVLVLLSVLAACSSSNGTYVDVTVTAEAGLSLDRESLTVKAPGKTDLVQSIAVGGTWHLTVSPRGLADGTIVTVEARGLKGSNVVVLDRARVPIQSGHRVSVSLSLTAACSGVSSCTDDQTCRNGSCGPIGSSGGDGGVADAVGKDLGSGTDTAHGDTTEPRDAATSADAPATEGGGTDASAGCVNGTTQPCSAPPLNKMGACGLDTATCKNGQWTGCVDTKGADICELGNDNNCNGLPNEGCPCVNGTVQDCGHATVGSCKKGKSTCQNAVWGACVGNVEPAPRDCSSAADNDCDGAPDNTTDTVCKCAVGGPPQACGAHLGNDGKGPCKAGTQTCVLAANKASSDWSPTCSGAVGPAPADTCDPGNDSNCNGTINEGCPCVNGTTKDCGHAAVGICKTGKSTCQNAVQGACVGNVDPAPRNCTSALDNDCNGTADNLETAFCTCAVGGGPRACLEHAGFDGKGICKAGSQTCVASADKTTSSWGTCAPGTGPGAEVCDAPGLDENCDGQSNEGCECVNGASVPCDCGPATTCTNGKKGTCSVGKVTMYLDSDKDGYGDHARPAQVCPGATGYVSNADDCNDADGTFKPGTSKCAANNITRTSCMSGAGGATKTETCDQGCFNGACRTDGTIGLPGYVTCGTLRCNTSEGCYASDTDPSCGVAGDQSLRVQCDGPNDCASGSSCCVTDIRSGLQARCLPGACAGIPDNEAQVCDPLANTCNCKTMTFNFGQVFYVCS